MSRHSARNRISRLSLAVLAVLAIATGCRYLAESPDDVDAITMTRAEAERTILDSLEAVTATDELVSAPIPMQYGCVSAAMSLPTGPPWRYEALRSFDNPAEEQIANWRRQTMALTSQGYELQRETSLDDPRDVYLRDVRGFRVSLTYRTDSTGVTKRADVRAASPCVRDP